MATKYNNFCGGHVEMDGPGFRGTLVDGGLRSDECLAPAYAEAAATTASRPLSAAGRSAV